MDRLRLSLTWAHSTDSNPPWVNVRGHGARKVPVLNDPLPWRPSVQRQGALRVSDGVHGFFLLDSSWLPLKGRQVRAPDTDGMHDKECYMLCERG